MVRMRRIAAAVLAVVVGLVGLLAVESTAFASSRLKVSDPAEHEQLSIRPGWVSLAFDRTVKKSMLKVLVVNSKGRNVVSGDLIYQGSAVLVQLENNLAKDTYTVKYQVDRKDGQPEGGAYQFSYGDGEWTDIVKAWSGTAEQPPEMANPDPMATGPVETPTTTPPVVEVSEEPTPTPTESGTQSSATDSPSASVVPSASPTPTAPVSGGSDATGWIVGGVVLLVAAGGAGWWLVRRRRAA